MSFKYQVKVLEELEKHGVKPLDDTSPETIHDYLNDLYLYEIRRLKSRLIAGLIERKDYAARVEELRNRYPILALPVRFWAETE